MAQNTSAGEAAEGAAQAAISRRAEVVVVRMNKSDLLESLHHMAGVLANGPTSAKMARDFAATLNAHAATLGRVPEGVAVGDSVSPTGEVQ